MTFGQNLKRIRTERGRTQAEIANRAGIPACALSLYEHDKRCPTTKIVERLAQALLVGPGDLFSEKPENAPGSTNDNPEGV